MTHHHHLPRSVHSFLTLFFIILSLLFFISLFPSSSSSPPPSPSSPILYPYNISTVYRGSWDTPPSLVSFSLTNGKNQNSLFSNNDGVISYRIQSFPLINSPFASPPPPSPDSPPSLPLLLSRANTTHFLLISLLLRDGYTVTSHDFRVFFIGLYFPSIGQVVAWSVSFDSGIQSMVNNYQQGNGNGGAAKSDYVQYLNNITIGMWNNDNILEDMVTQAQLLSSLPPPLGISPLTGAINQSLFSYVFPLSTSTISVDDLDFMYSSSIPPSPSSDGSSCPPLFLSLSFSPSTYDRESSLYTNEQSLITLFNSDENTDNEQNYYNTLAEIQNLKMEMSADGMVIPMSVNGRSVNMTYLVDEIGRGQEEISSGSGNIIDMMDVYTTISTTFLLSSSTPSSSSSSSSPCSPYSLSFLFTSSPFSSSLYFSQGNHFFIFFFTIGLILLYLTVVQLRHSNQSISSRSKVSYLSIVIQYHMDIYIMLYFILLSIFVRPLFDKFIITAFTYCLLAAIIDFRYLLSTYSANNPDFFPTGLARILNGERNPPAVVSTIAEIRVRRNNLVKFYFLIYSSLLPGILIYYYISSLIPLLLTFIYSYWIPQIFHNIYSGTRKGITLQYLFGMSSIRILFLWYGYLCPYNWLQIQNNRSLVIILTLYQMIQITILYLQYTKGPRVFVPPNILKMMLPKRYDYHRERPHMVRKRERERRKKMERGRERERKDGGEGKNRKKKNQNDNESEMVPLSTTINNVVASSSLSPHSLSTSNGFSLPHPSGGLNFRKGANYSKIDSLDNDNDDNSHETKNNSAVTGKDAPFHEIEIGEGNDHDKVKDQDEKSLPTHPDDSDGDRSNEEEEETCAVCCCDIEDDSPPSSIMLTPCNHSFHKPCLLRWMAIKFDCPNCRTRLPLYEPEENYYFDNENEAIPPEAENLPVAEAVNGGQMGGGNDNGIGNEHVDIENKSNNNEDNSVNNNSRVHGLVGFFSNRGSFSLSDSIGVRSDEYQEEHRRHQQGENEAEREEEEEMEEEEEEEVDVFNSNRQ